jgi:two-component system, NtrC family, sensor histidine kinase PilS
MQDSSISLLERVFYPRAGTTGVSEELWRSITLFNYYRLIVGSLLLLLVIIFGDTLSLGSGNLLLFLRASTVYVVFVLISQLAIKRRQPRFGLQLAVQMGVDIACMTALSHASGGIQSSVGLLLLVSLAAAGLISRGRITLFFAALASIAVLLQHSYAVLVHDAPVAQYVQAGLLSIAYFAVAWLAHTLAKYATASERLATLRGVDLANMAEANRLVIQDAPNGVLVVDEHGLIRQYNPSAERLLGYDFTDADSPRLDQCSPLLAGIFDDWRKNQGRGYEVLRLPVTNSQVRVRFLPVQREGFWGAVVFLEDMQRVQTQAQQIKLAALGRLTANIAHEVRNPLSAISYATELLQEEIHGPAQERLYQIVRDNTARLNRIVQDVMQLNRRDRVQSELINLADKLPHFIDGLRHTEGMAQEIFAIELGPDCKINFDRGHFEQVLWNLCRNALRYCSKQVGSVKLLARHSDENRVVLDVLNDGSEINPDIVQQLFEPFFTTSVGGAGLGLYLARELCEANGATLDYVAQSDGGVCFRIVFGEKYEH